MVSKSSNMNERELFNEIQITIFDGMIVSPQNIHYKKNISNLSRHLKVVANMS
jgi:hypothetical protein